MNKIRRLDKNHDWTFGQGMNNYASESEAIAQRVKTRLWSFVGDWFLDLEHGLPWLPEMERNVNLAEIETMVRRCVSRTEGVARITAYQADLNPDTRKLTITVDYEDVYQQSHQAQYRTGG